eukprot:TRINITY_DN857_c5_g1_i1.p1 TRINITY_DN857_c5_g1~~TRINITY_DN857_c5_g1_i1.p1  ORF type:complete len:1071 (+),score=147.03 TRINITY_DN857_c5_g1_i1:113-3325(+)
MKTGEVGNEFIDCGANINLQRYRYEEVDELLKSAGDNNVNTIVLIGGCVESSKSAMEVAERSRSQPGHSVRVFFTAGLHPLESMCWNTTTRNTLLELLNHPLCVAVGETGLNYHNNTVPREVQKWVLKAHLELATSIHLPVYLHDREASADLLDIIEAHNSSIPRPPKYVIHCYEGASTESLLKRQLNLEIYFSFSGLVTLRHRNAQVLRSLSKIPSNRILTETDCPFLRPAGVPSDEGSQRAGGSQPSHTEIIGNFIAEKKGCETSVFADTAERFFNFEESENRFVARSPSASPQARPNNIGLYVNNTTINCAPDKSRGKSTHRFIVPFTLTKLCKQLRGVGIDTLVHPNNDVKSLLAASITDHRTVLLRRTKAINKVVDSIPAEQSSKLDIIYLQSDIPKTQVQQVLSDRRINLKEADLQGRCKMCNSDKWIKEKPSGVRGEVEHSVLSAYRRFWRCAGCRKVYWEGWVYSQAKDHFRSIGGLKKETKKKQASPKSCQKHRIEKKPITTETQQLFDSFTVIPIHNRYGVLVLDGANGEGNWTLATYTSKLRMSEEKVSQKALILVKDLLGLSIHPHELIPFETTHTTRRRFYILYLSDKHASIPGQYGARPPIECSVSGRPPFWMNTNGNFKFSPTLKTAWTLVKLGGVTACGDMVGSLVLKDIHNQNQLSSGDQPVTKSGHYRLKSAYYKAQVMHRTKPTCKGVNPDSYWRIELSLLNKGIVDPGRLRILWDTRPPPTWIESSISRLNLKISLDKTVERNYINSLKGWSRHINNLQKAAYQKSIHVVEAVKRSFSGYTQLADYTPYLFGSVSSGVVSSECFDVDICLRSKKDEKDDGEDDQSNNETLLLALHRLCDRSILTQSQAVLAARVPVVRGVIEGVPVDVAVAPLGCVNTLLFRNYFKKKPSLRLAAIIIKIWGTWSGVKSKDIGHFTAYSLVVLLLHFAIQTNLVSWEPLPKIEETSSVYDALPAITEADVAECPKIVFSFLSYYCDFDWSQQIVCIRQPQPQQRGDQTDDAIITDPYEDLNLARKMKPRQLLSHVRKFNLSFAAMRDGMLFNLLLDSRYK